MTSCMADAPAAAASISNNAAVSVEAAGLDGEAAVEEAATQQETAALRLPERALSSM